MRNSFINISLGMIASIFLSLSAIAQTPQELNYQAIARDISGNPISDANLEVVFRILQYTTSGSAVFTETQNTASNEFGLISLSIGSIEDISIVPWDDGPFFLEVAIDGEVLGTTKLLSVPYSLYSAEAANVFSGRYTDLTNTPDLSPFLTNHLWTQVNDKISYNSGYVGVGISDPRSKFAVQGENVEDSILFEVKNSLGQTVFAVYNQGVHITVDNNYAKGPRGGFSVGGFDRSTKGIQEYLRVTADSTRIFVNETPSKGSRGGFAVGGFDRSPSKGALYNYVDLTPTNSFIGQSAGANNQTGLNNFFGGYEAGLNNLIGGSNVLIGNQAGRSNNSNANVFIGNSAGLANTTAFGSVMIGDGTGIASNGSRNVFIGRRTAYANTTGDNNVYIGNDAGSEMTTSRYNTFIGSEAGDFAESGQYGVFIGARAGYDNNGYYNVVMGYRAGSNQENYNNENSTYHSSVLIGHNSGFAISSGSNNVFIGNYSGSNISSGSNNSLLGASTGSSTTGSNNVFIGYGSGSNLSGDSNFEIHNSNTGTPLMLGKFHSIPGAAWLRINAVLEAPYLATGSGTTLVIDGNGEIMKMSSSRKYKDDINNLDNVTDSFMDLRPVSFTWNNETATPGKEDFGLIAEEVEEILPELTILNKEGEAEGVSYHNVNIMAVKVIQSQQKEIEELKRRLSETEKLIKKILKEK